MNEVFVKTKGKARADKATYTREQVTDPSFRDDYGRIVPPGYIVFDFDKQPYIDIMYRILINSNLKCRMLKTTKGYHFMFKTTLNKAEDAIGMYNWLGLQCDVKACGTKETKQSYQSMRVNGIPREEVGINTDDLDDIDYAPRWMYIVSKSKKDQLDLTQDQTGGRNNLFHSDLMMKAKKAGFSYEEYCEMAHNINTYVLPKPLDEDELNTAIRPEEWDNLELGEDKRTTLKQAEDIVQYWNCVLVDDEDMAFYHGEKDRYSMSSVYIDRYMQLKYGSENISTNHMEEVMEQVGIILRTDDKYKVTRNSEYVLCNKQLVSVLKDEVRPNTRTIYTDVYYPFDFMPREEFDSFNGRAKSFMDEISCGNPNVKKIIWECLGCMVVPVAKFGKIFIWYGSGANGKSLLLNIMEAIMGNLLTHANILNINDKFALEDVVKGIANVTDDVGITTLRETGILKSLIDGSTIEVNRKFKQPIKWKPDSQFVMCCNEIPKIADTTRGMIRRLSFIPFDMQLSDDEIDVFLLDKILSDKDNLRYILSGAIYAYRDAVRGGRLTTIEKQEELKNDFLEENKEPISSFYDWLIDDHNGQDALCRYLDGKTTEEVYAEYKKWCENNGLRVETQRTFTTRFGKKLPAVLNKKIVKLGGQVFNVYQLQKIK